MYETRCLQHLHGTLPSFFHGGAASDRGAMAWLKPLIGSFAADGLPRLPRTLHDVPKEHSRHSIGHRHPTNGLTETIIDRSSCSSTDLRPVTPRTRGGDGKDELHLNTETMELHGYEGGDISAAFGIVGSGREARRGSKLVSIDTRHHCASSPGREGLRPT